LDKFHLDIINLIQLVEGAVKKNRGAKKRPGLHFLSARSQLLRFSQSFSRCSVQFIQQSWDFGLIALQDGGKRILHVAADRAP
jgi:hypothetical protein